MNRFVFCRVASPALVASLSLAAFAIAGCGGGTGDRVRDLAINEVLTSTGDAGIAIGAGGAGGTGIAGIPQSAPGTVMSDVVSSPPALIPLPSATPLPSTRGAANFNVVSRSADCNVPAERLTDLPVRQAAIMNQNGNTYEFRSGLGSGTRTDGGVALGWARFNDPDGLTPETQTVPDELGYGQPDGPRFMPAVFTAVSMPVGVDTYGNPVTGMWTPRGGTIIVESVTGSAVVVRGENVRFVPERYDENRAVGEFVTDFRVVYENVDGL
ncbi:MAG: hypothetical protein H7Y38_20680 [Armatimonadetes bacterium]|nr:hypothetical protein [Armatimonadota bacterium]